MTNHAIGLWRGFNNQPAHAPVPISGQLISCKTCDEVTWAASSIGPALRGGGWLVRSFPGECYCPKCRGALSLQSQRTRAATPVAQIANNGETYHGRPKTSQYIGVSHRPENKNNPYLARVMYRRKSITLGSFPTEIEAALAHDAASRCMRGDDTQCNFSPEQTAEIKAALAAGIKPHDTTGDHTPITWLPEDRRAHK